MAISGYILDQGSGASQRKSARVELRLLTEGIVADGASHSVRILNISETGLLLECDYPFAASEMVDIILPHAGRTGIQVIWASERFFGCQFVTPITQATLSAARLSSAIDDTQPAPVVPEPSTSTEVDLGARLQRLRVLRGMTQSQLAHAIGVSEAAVCNWEKGKSRPRADRAQAIADQLAVTLAELVDSTTSPDLATIVAQSRERIADAAGVAESRIRISIEL